MLDFSTCDSEWYDLKLLLDRVSIDWSVESVIEVQCLIESSTYLNSFINIVVLAWYISNIDQQLFMEKQRDRGQKGYIEKFRQGHGEGERDENQL